MSDDKAFKSLDHDFREGLRNNIRAADLIQRVQNYVFNPAAYPMSTNQLKGALGLLSHVLPQLKAVEHTQAPKREETREELIERITQLHAGATAGTQSGTVARTVAPDAAAEIRH